MTAMLPTQLSESVNALGQAARDMTAEIQADREQRAKEHEEILERQRKSSRRVMALLLVVALLVGGLVLLSVANRKLGMANRQLNKQNSRIVERIESCTTVGGECYEQSTKRTASVAAELIRANIAVAICARTERDATAIEACTIARVATPTEQSEPPPSGIGPDGGQVPEMPTPAPAPEPTP